MKTRDRSERLDPAVLKLAGILVIGALAPLLDSTIVNVALHTLGRDLNAGVSTIQWVGTAYLLAMAVSVPVTAWAVERFGGKRMWLVALTLFLAGSVLAGLAWSAAALIGFRVLQGVGAGLLVPILQTLLVRAAGGRQVGRLMAVVTLPALAGPILGPVAGGLIVGHLSWRWIFYVNVPVCLVALVLAWRGLPADSPGAAHRLDGLGLALLSPALAGVVYGLAEVGAGRDLGDPHVLVPVAAGVALFAGFGWRASRAVDPLIDLRLFRIRSFAASATLLLLSGFSMFGSMLLLPLYFQQVRGVGVLAAGLLLVPQGIGSLLARGLGALTDRFGAGPVVLAGVLLTAIGTLPFAFASRGPSQWLLSAALVVRGIGLSGTNLAVMVGAFRDVPRERVAHASGATRILQQLGGSFGAAALAVILQRQLAAEPAAVAFGHTFGWATLLAAIGVVPALVLRTGVR